MTSLGNDHALHWTGHCFNHDIINCTSYKLVPKKKKKLATPVSPLAVISWVVPADVKLLGWDIISRNNRRDFGLPAVQITQTHSYSTQQNLRDYSLGALSLQGLTLNFWSSMDSCSLHKNLFPAAIKMYSLRPATLQTSKVNLYVWSAAGPTRLCFR
jgi:hypothetical protein